MSPPSSLDDTHRVTAWLPPCWTHCKIQNTFLSCSFLSYTRIRWCTDSQSAPSSHSTFIGCTFSMFVCVLEGLDQPESLIHRSSHWKIIHGDLPQDAFFINDEEPSETFRNKIYHFKHTVHSKSLCPSNSSISSPLNPPKKNYFCKFCRWETTPQCVSLVLQIHSIVF